MRYFSLVFAICASFMATASNAQEIGSADQPLFNEMDFDPLRKFLPRSDIYQPVPGGKSAIEDIGDTTDISIEEQTYRRNGGLVVGYCIKSSCTRVTHLAVLQVCNGYIGGPDGTNQLVLGVVRLPYGDTPGYIKSLQGRNYAHNFAAHGPVEQTLHDTSGEKVSANFSLWAHGSGEVAPLEIIGEVVSAEQSKETIAVQMTPVRDISSGAQGPRFDVRHLCRPQLS